MSDRKPNICFTKKEIAEICRTSRKARQIAFLCRNGVKHFIDAQGWPVVLRSAVEGEKIVNVDVEPWVPNVLRKERLA